MDNVLCHPQAYIKECDLEVTFFVRFGPGRLATQLANPLSGFEVIQESQPFLSLSGRVSSSEVFVVDEVVVVFVGLSNGHVQKVYCCVMCVWNTYQYIAICTLYIIYVYILCYTMYTCNVLYSHVLLYERCCM